MRESEKYRKKKRVAAGSAVLTVVLLTAFFVLAAMTAYKSGIQWDFTRQKVFTLTEDSLNELENLDTPVRIAVVCPEGQEEPMVRALLDEYEKRSDQITVSYIDAEKDPAALAAYDLGDVAAVYNDSLIVEGGKRTKVIGGESLFSYTASGNYFYGEREITGAVKYVSEEKLPAAYFISGHGEVSAGEELTKAVADLGRNAYEVKPLVLLQQEIPEDAAVLVLVSPANDLTQAEIGKLDAFMKQGGGLFLMVDPVLTSNRETLANLNDFVNGYGIDISNNYVVEEDSSYYLTDRNTYLIPRYGSHEITDPIGSQEQLVVLPAARGLGTVDYDEQAVALDVLIQTSEKAWARNDMTNTSGGRTSLDQKGPIALGFAAQKSNAETRARSSRLVVVGDSDYIRDGGYDMQANSQLFLNSMDWLRGGQRDNLIAGKEINSEKLVVRGSDFTKLAVICLAVLPLICFAGAFALWRFRRNG